MPPQLPFGVKLLEYVVHYAQTMAAVASNTTSRIESDQTAIMVENYGIIGGLSSGASYQFWVEAKVLETVGVVQSGDVVSTNATLFIPGTVF